MIAEEDIKIGAKVKFKDSGDWEDVNAVDGEYFIVEDSDYSASFFTKHTVELRAVQADKDCFTLVTNDQSKEVELPLRKAVYDIARPILAERKVGKLRTDLFEQGFPLAIQEICKVLTWAKENKGYGDHDWQAIPDPEVCFSGAASRHRMKHNIQREVDQFEMLHCVDEESGIMHLCHQATNVLMELELALRGHIK